MERPRALRLEARATTPARAFSSPLGPEIFCRRTVTKLLLSLPLAIVTTESPSLAVIDGMLCQLSRRGTRTVGHAPLATAVVEFRHGSLRLYVREHPYGLLPGIANLYALDANFRLLWMAEWPEQEGLCTAIVGEAGQTLVAEAASGAMVKLDAVTGRLLAIEQSLAAAS